MRGWARKPLRDSAPNGSRYVGRNVGLNAGTMEHWLLMEDLDGVPWYDAPAPPRKHACWAQTIAYVGRNQEARCPCGGQSVNRGRWIWKNERLNG